MVLVAHSGDLDAAFQALARDEQSKKAKAHVVGPGAAARACLMPPTQDELAERPANEKARCLRAESCFWSALMLDASGRLRPAPHSVDNGAAAWAPIGSLGRMLPGSFSGRWRVLLCSSSHFSSFSRPCATRSVATIAMIIIAAVPLQQAIRESPERRLQEAVRTLMRPHIPTKILKEQVVQRKAALLRVF